MHQEPYTTAIMDLSAIDGLALNMAQLTNRFKYFKASDGGDIAYADQTYHYRNADGIEMFDIWVPGDVGVIRGMFLTGNPGGIGGDSRPYTRDPIFRAFARQFGFGLIGLHSMPGRNIFAESGKMVTDALDDIARIGPYRELANVPFVTEGNSNGGSTSYGFLNFVPHRVICFSMNVSSASQPEIPADDALRVPGFICVGEHDHLIRNGVDRVTELMSYARARGALWSWCVEKKGHEIGHIYDYQFTFHMSCILARLPSLDEPGGDPRLGPVTLRPVSLESGWLADDRTWDSGLVTVAPYCSFPGDVSKASWLLNKDCAILFRGVATYDNPVTLEIVGLTLASSTSGIHLSADGGAFLKPDTEIVLRADPSGMPFWSRITFFEGANPIGEVLASGVPEIRYRLPAGWPVNSFTLEAVSLSGIVRTATPVHVIVSDNGPGLTTITPPVPGRRLGQGDSRKVDVPSNNTREIVVTPLQLLACELNPEQEKAFLAEAARVSEFWSALPEDHAIRMSVADNAVDAAQFHGDTRAVVKSVFSESGLYLLFEVQDPSWYLEQSWGSDLYQKDAVEILLDSRSIDDIWNCPFGRSFTNAAWSLSLTTAQYQFPFGNFLAPGGQIRRAQADPFEHRGHAYPREEFEEATGIRVAVSELANGRRAMEWFLPWQFVGTAGIRNPVAGTAIPFSPSYNDFDPIHNTIGKLRWLDHRSPWDVRSLDGRCECWGEIVLGPPLASVADESKD